MNIKILRHNFLVIMVIGYNKERKILHLLQILTELNLKSPLRVRVSNTPNSSVTYIYQSEFIVTTLFEMFGEASKLQENDIVWFMGSRSSRFLRRAHQRDRGIVFAQNP